MAGYIRTCSIDIGKKNFAICIEEIKEKKYESGIEYNPDGTITEETKKIIDPCLMNGEIIFHKNYDLTDGADQKKKFDTKIYLNMIKVLENIKKLLDSCDHIVIEEQMKTNLFALKLGQHCMSYFLMKYGTTKNIVEFPAFHKTKVLGAPKIRGVPYKSGKPRWKAMSKPQRKKWAVETMCKILSNRKEKERLRELSLSAKKDDLADTFLMGKAYQYKLLS